MKIVQALEGSNILLKEITKTIKNETKEQKGEFLRMLLGAIGANLLENMLTGKGILRVGYRNKQGKGILRAGYGNKKKLIPPHPLTAIEMQKYDQNEPRFNDVYSRDKLPKEIKTGAYVINLDEYAHVGTYWIAWYVSNNEIIYFDCFGVENVPKEIIPFIRHKTIKTNIFRIQANNSIMYGYFCIGFKDFILEGKTLISVTLVCFLV